MTIKSIGVFFFVILLGGAAVWWFLGDSLLQQSEVNMTGVGTFSELSTSNQPLECQFTFSNIEYSGEGVSFITNGQVRTSARVQYNGSVITSDYIIAGNVAYVWSDYPEGLLAARRELDEGSTVTDGESLIGMDDEVSYECQPWSVDDSVFVPPADIEFMDTDSTDELTEWFDGMSREEIAAMVEEDNAYMYGEVESLDTESLQELTEWFDGMSREEIEAMVEADMRTE